MQTILLIRHAEKPERHTTARGVSEEGTLDANELTVQGWQRAGALAQLFTSATTRHPALTAPSRLFAAARTPESSSRRSISTLEPLARVIGHPVQTSFGPGQEQELATHVCQLDGTTLIAREHKRLPRLAANISNDGTQPPVNWPDDRFDLVWIFVSEADGTRRFVQVAQRPLAGDRAERL